MWKITNKHHETLPVDEAVKGKGVQWHTLHPEASCYMQEMGPATLKLIKKDKLEGAELDANEWAVICAKPKKAKELRALRHKKGKIAQLRQQVKVLEKGNATLKLAAAKKRLTTLEKQVYGEKRTQPKRASSPKAPAEG